MTSSLEEFAQQLDAAAARIDDMPRHQVRALFRRAALCMRNTDRSPMTLDDEYHAFVDALNATFGDLGLELDGALSSVAAEMREPKANLIRRILREWLEVNAYLPTARMRDEDGEAN